MAVGKPQLSNLPTEIILNIFDILDRPRQLEPLPSYPTSVPLGRPVQPTDGGGNFDSLSRCCRKLRALSLPYLFRCLRIRVAEEPTAVAMLRLYISSPWVLQNVRKLRFIMDIRANIVAELPTSLMEPDLSTLMVLIATFFRMAINVESLHFIIKSEIVSTALRRVFRKYQVANTGLSNVKSLKFSAGSEWIIGLCGSACGVQELENSPGLSGSEYIPYSIDFIREEACFAKAGGYLSRIGDFRAANIMKGISTLNSLHQNLLTKVCIFGKFTQEGLLVFIDHIPAVTNLSVIGEILPVQRAYVLARLQRLAILNIAGELECIQYYPETSLVSPVYLWHFAQYIPSLQQMWSSSRYVGNIVRDESGKPILQHISWEDTWTTGKREVDIEMGGC
ncbi:hypothetical protein H072_6873 [Dactylellina haptotyla CBS 200.50]|uniref:F-box domain-containing protein n=1 Tax=Dactylellina haptotyla (strain CBS 200.50) TaxID=1284197 RepID=S8AE56_DACHA|nr:hypothetical protein H072_6873 [Dactylellina haptotyla CBS 200.50]